MGVKICITSVCVHKAYIRGKLSAIYIRMLHFTSVALWAVFNRRDGKTNTQNTSTREMQFCFTQDED